MTYINEKVGTRRVAGGGLDQSAGTIEALDSIVATWAAGKATIIEAAKKVAVAMSGFADEAQYKYADYYVRVFEKLQKSDGYAAKELGRLEGMLKKGGMAPAKADELRSKTNILRKFIKEVTGKDEL